LVGGEEVLIGAALDFDTDSLDGLEFVALGAGCTLTSCGIEVVGEVALDAAGGAEEGLGAGTHALAVDEYLGGWAHAGVVGG
jgi:hypothetical protein